MGTSHGRTPNMREMAGAGSLPDEKSATNSTAKIADQMKLKEQSSTGPGDLPSRRETAPNAQPNPGQHGQPISAPARQRQIGDAVIEDHEHAGEPDRHGNPAHGCYRVAEITLASSALQIGVR